VRRNSSSSNCWTTRRRLFRHWQAGDGLLVFDWGRGKVGSGDASNIGLPRTSKGGTVPEVEVAGWAVTDGLGPDKKAASVFCGSRGWLSAEWYVPLLDGLVWARRVSLGFKLSSSSKVFRENSVMSRSTSRPSTSTQMRYGEQGTVTVCSLRGIDKKPCLHWKKSSSSKSESLLLATGTVPCERLGVVPVLAPSWPSGTAGASFRICDVRAFSILIADGEVEVLVLPRDALAGAAVVGKTQSIDLSLHRSQCWAPPVQRSWRRGSRLDAVRMEWWCRMTNRGEYVRSSQKRNFHSRQK